MNRKIINYIFRRLIIVVLMILTSCNAAEKMGNESEAEIRVEEWDNTKYEGWASSVGLDVYNKNSFNTSDDNSNKANRILHIEDLNDPITLKFNNNGKARNFILTVYYDYEQIPFKISKINQYNDHFQFELDDGYEIELPLFLPTDLEMSGNHKLLLSFTIGHDIHAKDIPTQSDWYGTNIVYDLVYDIDDLTFVDHAIYEPPTKTIDLTYSFTLNEDFTYSILDTEILPNVNKVISINSGENLKLIYNVSTLGNDTEKLLLLATIGFEQVNIDGEKYKLLQVPKGVTGFGEIELTAPEEPGLYEVIALAVYNPFDKINLDSNLEFDVYSSVRFTLEVR